MNTLILVLAALMLVRNAIVVRHHPAAANIVMLLFWMAVLAHSLIPSAAIFAISSILVVLAVAARAFPVRAQELGERLGLPKVGGRPQERDDDPGAG